ELQLPGHYEILRISRRKPDNLSAWIDRCFLSASTKSPTSRGRRLNSITLVSLLNSIGHGLTWIEFCRHLFLCSYLSFVAVVKFNFVIVDGPIRAVPCVLKYCSDYFCCFFHIRIAV